MDLTNKVFIFLLLTLMYASEEEAENQETLEQLYDSITNNSCEIKENEYIKDNRYEEWMYDIDSEFKKYLKGGLNKKFNPIAKLERRKCRIYSKNSWILKLNFFSIQRKDNKFRPIYHIKGRKNFSQDHVLLNKELAKKKQYYGNIKKCLHNFILESIAIYKFVMSSEEIESLLNTAGSQELTDEQKKILKSKFSIMLLRKLLLEMLRVYKNWEEFNEDGNMKYLLNISKKMMTKLKEMSLTEPKIELYIYDSCHPTGILK